MTTDIFSSFKPSKMVFGLFDSPTPYRAQEYSKLHKAAQDSGHLFVDSEFPAENKAIFSPNGKNANKLSGIQWKRPKDICQDPKLFVEGASSNDVSQGQLGNCWFVAACSCLTQHKEIWHKVIPEHNEQEWDAEHPEKYAGIFHFQFWRYGEWIDVVIDDQLPTRNGQLIFVHSKSRNEFWSALLEKAYAKLFGSYEALDGGELAEALEDFTGGIAEPIDLVEGGYATDEPKRDELFKVMKAVHKNNALQAAAIPAKSQDEMEQSIDIGLVKGHAYGITAVKRIAIAGSGLFNLFNREKLSMVRLRNPWGGTEWKGAFSDGSPEWDRIDKNDREKVGLTFEEDGEFWMTMEDYCKYFTNMSICRVMNTSFFSMEKTWWETAMASDWAKPNRDGGCINNRETFLNNPMFRFDVTAENEDEVLLGLTQKAGRGEGQDRLTIGFTVLKVEDNREYRLHRLQEVVKSSTFKNARSIILRHTFKRGRYVLIATTFEPGQAGSFLLRIYCGNNTSAQELQEDKPVPNIFQQICGCFTACKQAKILTRVKVIRAVGLEHQDKVGGADPYAIIHTERQKVRTPTVKDSTSPEWNTTGIFYRADPVGKPIRVDIWNSNALRDEFMGRAIIPATDEMDGKHMEVDLVANDKNNPEKRPGKLFVEITTSHNLIYL